MFYSVGIFRTSIKTAPKRQGEKPDYIRGLQQRTGNLNIKRLLLIGENQISQVKISQV